MSPSRHSIVTPFYGLDYHYDSDDEEEDDEKQQREFFDDMPRAERFADAMISRIAIRHGGLVDSLQVHYSPADIEAVKHGGNGGQLVEFSLDEGEIITAVEGSYNHQAICHLKFFTNQRTMGPYGAASSQTFTLRPNIPGDCMALISFSGRASNLILALRATFVELPRHLIPPKMVKYEKVGAGELGPIPVSQFAGYLTTPSIMLTVGPEKTKFHANEAALCRLPFFKAALQGAFREAVEKTIDMPEDDAFAVTAMIEFLYTGSYTYAYDSTGLTGPGNAPPGKLAEGIFHVAVCATASKYGCLKLKGAAWKMFETVMRDTSDIDRLRLWKAAYMEGFQQLGLDGELNKEDAQKELRRWVGVLFKDHGEEMDAALLGDPKLARDLLRLATITVE